MEDNLLVNSQTPHLPFQLRSLGPVSHNVHLDIP